MATTRQKAAARKNIKKARSAQSRRAQGQHVTKGSSGLSTQKRNRMSRETFAFPKERKEPLNDARHVRNAIARFDQVEGVSDQERDAAWRRIRTAARKYGVEVQAKGWRSLMKGGRTGRSRR
jgi:predicted Ser/Thr protein kinase